MVLIKIILQISRIFNYAKRNDIKSILIIGAGPIVIGQACEFDYSGAQACKALREEGYKVILVNSNPATIMTDPQMADSTYIEPIEWRTLEKIIEIEKPDALLPTMGGQTALNCALDLDRHGVLKQHNVEMIGANKEAIDKAEDRDLFRQAMLKIGLQMPMSEVAHNMEQAIQIQEKLDFQPLFDLHSLWEVVAEELHITVKNLYKSVKEVWTYLQLMNYLLKSQFLDGKSLRWKLSEIKKTIA